MLPSIVGVLFPFLIFVAMSPLTSPLHVFLDLFGEFRDVLGMRHQCATGAAEMDSRGPHSGLPITVKKVGGQW
ncbi:hypothetical protein EDD16DRAFT_1532689 [Pisolithus croceorrhizus]|nr:hypothetical protein EDD16DRAFT_1532689 [Pisolithus croceorrhizus]